VTHVLHALVTAHAVTRDPAGGRLAGDTVLALPLRSWDGGGDGVAGGAAVHAADRRNADLELQAR
jgi:hypothetical protein